MLANAAASTSRPPLSRVRRRSSSFSEPGSFDGHNNGPRHNTSRADESDGFCSDTFSTREPRMRKRIRKDPRVSRHRARTGTGSTACLPPATAKADELTPARCPQTTATAAAQGAVASTSLHRPPTASCAEPPGRRTRSPLGSAGQPASLTVLAAVRARASVDSQLSACTLPAASLFAQSTSSRPPSAYSDESVSDESSSAPPTPPPFCRLPFSAPDCFASFSFLRPSNTRMDLDPLPDRAPDNPDEVELSRLHHLAFEQLRRETERDGEGFVNRLRRWESSKCRASVVGLALELVVESGSAGPPSSPASSHDSNLDNDEDEYEEELEVTLSQPPVPSRPSGPPPPLEVADLVARLSAEGLEDFSAVREYQSRCG